MEMYGRLDPPPPLPLGAYVINGRPQTEKVFSAASCRILTCILDYLLTQFSWYPGLYSIHYIWNWQLTQQAG